MSGPTDRLARTRLAIIEQVQRREGPHERREESEPSRSAGAASRARDRTGGWFAGIRHVLSTWWRHHPAHMGLELATPMLSTYARRKPLQYLGIAAAVGAAVMILRPWRLVSATGLLVALFKSSQLSGVIASAMAASDYGGDAPPYDE